MIDVAFTPGERRQTEVAIVVDVLRASSTAVVALAAGYERVLCVDTVDAARRLRSPGRTLAGERGCLPIDGFDIGNSPRAIGRVAGGELVLCTTNGTPAITDATARAQQVLIGSLLNLRALAAAIPSGRDVAIMCAGTDGRFALEDAYVAGRIVALLAGMRSDGAHAAERLAGAYGSSLGALAGSANAGVLRDTGQEGDIAYCAQESVSQVVPQVVGGGPEAGVAVLVEASDGAREGAGSGASSEAVLGRP